MSWGPDTALKEEKLNIILKKRKSSLSSVVIKLSLKGIALVFQTMIFIQLFNKIYMSTFEDILYVYVYTCTYM